MVLWIFVQKLNLKKQMLPVKLHPCMKMLATSVAVFLCKCAIDVLMPQLGEMSGNKNIGGDLTNYILTRSHVVLMCGFKYSV